MLEPLLREASGKGTSVTAYEISEVVNKCCSPNPAPSGLGYPVKVSLLELGQWHPSSDPQGSFCFPAARGQDHAWLYPGEGPSPPLQQPCAAGCLGWLCLKHVIPLAALCGEGQIPEPPCSCLANTAIRILLNREQKITEAWLALFSFFFQKLFSKQIPRG